MELKLQPFEQAGTQMYVGTMRVEDILDVSHVDEWRRTQDKEAGYQRAPEPRRTEKIARYLHNNPKPLMPTSILLGYRGSLKKEACSDGTFKITIPEGKPLWIIDGQHRIYGFERAIGKLGLQSLQEYVLPVVIIENPSIEDEANQFRIINETMKKVRTDLARRIIALRISTLGLQGREEFKYEGRLWEAVSVAVINILGTEEDSPWYERIQPPNTTRQPNHIIRELSFSTSLKPILKETPFCDWSTDAVGRTLKNYWKAWKLLIPEAFRYPNDYVLMKTPGVFSLHRLARFVVKVLNNRGIEYPSPKDFCSILQDLGQFAKGKYWHKANPDGAAMAGSMKGFTMIAETMEVHLSKAGHNV